MRRKCQLINKYAETSIIKFGKIYTYEIITSRKNFDGNSVFLAFPYHLYDDDDLIDVITEKGFTLNFIDIKRQRKLKLEKLNERR